MNNEKISFVLGKIKKIILDQRFFTSRAFVEL